MWIVIFIACVVAFRSSIDEDDDVTLSRFDEYLIEKFNEEYDQFDATSDYSKKLRNKIGVLGVYFRIYKELVPRNCIEGILVNIQSANPWLYPDTGEKAESFLNRGIMQSIISDNLLSMEVTASQLLCFFTTSKVHAFEFIPFCRFRFDITRGKVAYDNQTDMSYMDLVMNVPGKGDPTVVIIFNRISLRNGLLGFSSSFCPDPCCHDVLTTSPIFSAQECLLNTCASRDQCIVKGEFNNDLRAMRNNRWNISCPCEEGFTYRSDVSACVHENICDNGEQCPPNHDCIDTVRYPYYKCICQIGFVRGFVNNFFKDRSDVCQPVEGWEYQWHGLAHSELHPKGISVELLLTVVVHAVIVQLLYITM
uniref:EGF-like domain-containing protein n=1 Tax=Heterorhabditis bacteriophora TaxID=37862 RepID=A0A1I7XST1_HETBA